MWVYTFPRLCYYLASRHPMISNNHFNPATVPFYCALKKCRRNWRFPCAGHFCLGRILRTSQWLIATTVFWPCYNKIHTLSTGQSIQWSLFPPVVFVCYNKTNFSTWMCERAHIQGGSNGHRAGSVRTSRRSMTKNKKSLRFSFKCDQKTVHFYWMKRAGGRWK